MVSASTDNANVNSVPLIPASETFDNIDAISCIQVVDGTLTINAPDLQIELLALAGTIAQTHAISRR